MSDGNCNSTIGSMPTTFNNAPDNTSSLSGLFLNTKYSSSCNGTATAWNFCYYVSEFERQNISVQAGVWREENGSYKLVNGSLIDLPIPEAEIGFQFVCRHWLLNSTNEFFDVQEGDIVGVYVNDTLDINDVHVMGVHTSGNGLMKAGDITDVHSQVSSSELTQVNYSLYLVSRIGTL